MVRTGGIGGGRLGGHVRSFRAKKEGALKVEATGWALVFARSQRADTRVAEARITCRWG